MDRIYPYYEYYSTVNEWGQYPTYTIFLRTPVTDRDPSVKDLVSQPQKLGLGFRV